MGPHNYKDQKFQVNKTLVRFADIEKMFNIPYASLQYAVKNGFITAYEWQRKEGIKARRFYCVEEVKIFKKYFYGNRKATHLWKTHCEERAKKKQPDKVSKRVFD